MSWGLNDLLDALDRWDEWKNMRATPNRVDAHEKRIAELEQKLNGPWPPDICRLCGKRAARLSRAVEGDSRGMITEWWDCSACGRRDFRHYKASTK